MANHLVYPYMRCAAIYLLNYDCTADLHKAAQNALKLDAAHRCTNCTLA